MDDETAIESLQLLAELVPLEFDLADVTIEQMLALMESCDRDIYEETADALGWRP